jgi:hypothetical protein
MQRLVTLKSRFWQPTAVSWVEPSLWVQIQALTQRELHHLP